MADGFEEEITSEEWVILLWLGDEDGVGRRTKNQFAHQTLPGIIRCYSPRLPLPVLITEYYIIHSSIQLSFQPCHASEGYRQRSCLTQVIEQYRVVFTSLEALL